LHGGRDVVIIVDVVCERHTGGGWRRTALGVFVLAALLLALAAPVALARNAYVANSSSGNVSVIDTASGEVVGEPIDVGSTPGGIAITPDGRHAYVANFGSDSVSVIDTSSNLTVGNPILVGDGPRGVAITPDGKRAYVANQESGTVSVIDTTSDEVVGDPIAVGARPQGVAIAPSGGRVYVANSDSDSVSVIDTSSNLTVGDPIAVGSQPLAIAIAPDGKRVYVTSLSSNSVSVIDTDTESVIAIPFSSYLIGIAITPDGGHAYVANWGPGTVSVIDTTSDEVVGDPIAVGSLAFGVAMAPDGGRAYVANEGSDNVSVIDTSSNLTVGDPIPVGSRPFGIAITPDQPPLASLGTGVGIADQPVQLDASASRDPDGQIARYDWNFGDGQTAPDAGATPIHTYSAPGTYLVTVTETDNEDCSTSFVFTGLTAYCNGSSLASATSIVQVVARTGDLPAPLPTGPVVAPPQDMPTSTPESSSNVFRFRGSRHDTRRGIVELRVWVPGPGALSLRGNLVRTVKRIVGGPGTATLVVRPKHMEMQALKRRGHLKVRVRVTFRPDGGAPRTSTQTLKLVRKSG
jgi:YVTN family beta-propeller protein